MKKGRALRRVKSVLWKVLGVLVVLGLWQGAIEVFHIKKYVLPSPIQVLFGACLTRRWRPRTTGGCTSARRRARFC